LELCGIKNERKRKEKYKNTKGGLMFARLEADFPPFSLAYPTLSLFGIHPQNLTLPYLEPLASEEEGAKPTTVTAQTADDSVEGRRRRRWLRKNRGQTRYHLFWIAKMKRKNESSSGAGVVTARGRGRWTANRRVLSTFLAQPGRNRGRVGTSGSEP